MLLKHKAAVVLLSAALLAGCGASPAAILLSLIPDGTFAALLNNMQDVDTPNTRKLAELGQKEDWNGIAALAQENLARDPGNADWWIISGYAYIRLNQIQRANQAFAEAVRISPSDIDAWNLLAESYRVMGQPDRAIRTIENALRVAQDSPMSYYVMGRSFQDLKRPDRAFSYYEQTVQRAPRFADGWYAYGHTAWILGKRPEYSNAIQSLQPLDPAAAQRLAALSGGK